MDREQKFHAKISSTATLTLRPSLSLVARLCSGDYSDRRASPKHTVPALLGEDVRFGPCCAGTTPELPERSHCSKSHNEFAIPSFPRDPARRTRSLQRRRARQSCLQ